MTSDTSQYDSLTRWLGEDTDDHPSLPPDTGPVATPPWRKLARVGALALPWMLMLVVVLATTGTSTPGPDADGARTVTTPSGGGTTTGRPEGGTTEHATDRSAADIAVPGDDQPVASGVAADGPDAVAVADIPADVAASAVGLVRDAVTISTDDTSSALDVATAEPPQPLGSEQWLVRVRAVVLRGDAREWRSATHEVWAVAVGVRDQRVIGLDVPWRVSRQRPRVAALEWSAARVDDAAVRTALEHAGIEPASDLEPEQHAALPDIVRVRTTDGQGNGHVWVRTTPEPQVLGASVDVTP